VLVAKLLLVEWAGRTCQLQSCSGPSGLDARVSCKAALGRVGWTHVLVAKLLWAECAGRLDGNLVVVAA
jgi:hypothetical protein